MNSGKDDKIDITPEEMERFKEAMKKEEFRKLLCEYAEEIQDPENRRKYEEEIAQMEREKGMDVQFIHPNPGYVIKTSNKRGKKVFINVCSNDKVGKPVCSKTVRDKGRGLNWSVPHSMAPAREDKDHSGQTCDVYDVVFHPDALRMAENPRFKSLLNDVSVEALQRQFGVAVNKENLKFPKMKFKGVPQATVVRSRKEDNPGIAQKDKSDSSLGSFPYPYSNETSEEKTKRMQQEVKEKNERQLKREETAMEKEEQKTDSTTSEESNNNVLTPKYEIVHRSEMDMQQYTNDKNSTLSMRPKELVVHIDLPGIKSALKVELDVFPKRLTLKSSEPRQYSLDVVLPYEVDEDNGSAKFDKGRQRLSVTLPVLPKSIVGDQVQETEAQDPLIEVVSEDSQRDVVEECNKPVKELETEPVSDNLTTESSQSKVKPDEKRYRLPTVEFKQDRKELFLLSNVTNVKHNSISFDYIEESSLKVSYSSVGSGGFPIHYCYIVRFDCPVSESDVNVKMVANCVRLSVLKHSGWIKSCHLSLDGNEWQKHILEPEPEEKTPTEVTIPSQCSKSNDTLSHVEDGTKCKHESAGKTQNLDKTQHKSKADEEAETNCDSSKGTTSNIQSKSGINSSSESEQTNGSADPSEADFKKPLPVDRLSESSSIEVVETSPRCNLHSILKRSVSESSDDAQIYQSRGRHASEGCLNAADSLVEEDESCSADDYSGRRSVSFSERIETTTFKKNDSVTSLNKTLRNKRKKARRRERAEEAAKSRGGRGRRRRCSSGGSSSADEVVARRTITGAGGDASSSKTPERSIASTDTDDDDDDSQHSQEGGESSRDGNSLDAVDHSTKCAVNFGNSVMFELDDC